MPIFRSRTIVLMTYAALSAHGFASGGSGFLLLFALQLDMLGLLVLYGTRPSFARRSSQPSILTLLFSSVPVLIINAMLAIALGSALGEYPKDGPGPGIKRATVAWGDVMVAMTIASFVGLVLDRINYRRHKAFWETLDSRMALTVTLLGLLGYIGFGLLLWLGRHNGQWVILCLALARLVLELVLRSHPEDVAEPLGSTRL